MTTSDPREYQEGPRLRKRGRPGSIRAATTLAAVIVSLPAQLPDFIRTETGQRYAISGIAFVRHVGAGSQFLVAHDNRGPGENRLALVTLGSRVTYTPVPWPPGKPLPGDLESLSSLPGAPGRYVTSTSDGTVSLLELTGDTVALRGAFTLPARPPLPNFEGLSVQRVNGQLIIAWGQRGAGPQPAVLFWGTFDPDRLLVTGVSSVTITVPFPSPQSPDTRHIADIKIDSAGAVLISSTNDPGDDGPFQSALYLAGRFLVSGDAVTFEPRVPLAREGSFPGHKVEAIELMENEREVVLGTDDEHQGGAVAVFPR